MLLNLLDGLFLALHTTLALMRSYVRSQQLCARTMTMEDAYQVKLYVSIARTQWWLGVLILLYRTQHFARHT